MYHNLKTLSIVILILIIGIASASLVQKLSNTEAHDIIIESPITLLYVDTLTGSHGGSCEAIPLTVTNNANRAISIRIGIQLEGQTNFNTPIVEFSTCTGGENSDGYDSVNAGHISFVRQSGEPETLLLAHAQLASIPTPYNDSIVVAYTDDFVLQPASSVSCIISIATHPLIMPGEYHFKIEAVLP